ncbi:MAG: hypothetical protein M1818_001066 [Claussenomyces sp. TS43310]|nr:MAG: hypothetical protein M1818_001066 [Claussenomyces sp. TS43310]
MLNPSPSRILISGVTGYIGGAILHELSKRKKESNYVVTAIVRSKDKAEKLEEANVETILFKGLDDLEACRKAASEHDGEQNSVVAEFASFSSHSSLAD